MILAVCPNPSVDCYVWVESLEPGLVHRAVKEKRFPGGKGVHVALAAAELGEEVTLLGYWGGDTGSWIKSECVKKNIQCIGPELNQWSRTCITFKSDGKYDETELLGAGPEITGKNYHDFLDLFRQHAGSAGVVTLSGSWPVGAPDDGYAELIKASNEVGIPVILDATGEPFRRGLMAHPTAIHLNLPESRAFTGLTKIPEIHGYFRDYADLVAITSGQDGLYLSHNDRFLHGSIIPKRIYSSVGSGDCLTAGIASALKNGMNEDDMVRLGVACGGANCMREELGMLSLQDVKKLMPEVEVNTYKN